MHVTKKRTKRRWLTVHEVENGFSVQTETVVVGPVRVYRSASELDFEEMMLFIRDYLEGGD